MDKEQFIEELHKKKIVFFMENGRIMITDNTSVDLPNVTSLPSDVTFANKGSVDLQSLILLPPGIVFKNSRTVYLDSLEELPEQFTFENGGNLYLNLITRIPKGVKFKMKEDANIYLKELLGGWLDEWSGNISGINSKTLLYKMVALGLFDRK
jgi:hypothetical protein